MDGHDSRQPDPWAILGVDSSAGDDEVRAAYIEMVRQHPPDRDQEQFERIRDAYELLRDPRRRAEMLIFSTHSCQDFQSLLAGQPVQRRHAGPGPWLASMKR